MTERAPVVLIVLDGFGLGDGGPTDSTAVAHTPFFDRAHADFPMASIETSGESVGLPPGQMGNSEVGHMTLGAGRIIDQDMSRIGKALAAGDAAHNAILQQAFSAVAESGGRLHLMGLLSDGGVHSHQSHLEALLAECARQGVAPALHCFLDGRDTPPRSGHGFVDALLPHVDACGGQVATVIGRYWAMDRDNRWERVQRAFDAMVLGQGTPAESPLEAVAQSYAADVTDEFIEPTVIAGGVPIQSGDAVLFFNFRADRAREITAVLANQCPERWDATFDRRTAPDLAAFICLTAYDAEFDLPVAYPKRAPEHILGEIVAGEGLSQLRMAETEKYAHVTFFFNGGTEEPYPREERVLVPSPRDVDTYDHKPEMSALTLTQKLLQLLSDGDYGFVLINYANPDMVGHTGVLPAAVKAVETIDQCLEQVIERVRSLGGDVLITADHGNCEVMVDPATGEPHTAHTTNPVPIWWIASEPNARGLRDGGLADVAPTVLELMGLPVPSEMTGRSLLTGD